MKYQVRTATTVMVIMASSREAALEKAMIRTGAAAADISITEMGSKRESIFPDLRDYQSYCGLVRQAEHFANLRASVGESSSAWDISQSTAEADAERQSYTATIARLAAEAEQYLPGAMRWKDAREVLPEFPWH